MLLECHKLKFNICAVNHFKLDEKFLWWRAR